MAKTNVKPQQAQLKPGKVMHYILPISPFPYNEIVDFTILKVELVKPIDSNDGYRCKVLEVIREESGNGYYTYCMKDNFEITCSKQYLFNLTNKFNKEKNIESNS